jgi:hypothetical protein
MIPSSLALGHIEMAARQTDAIKAMSPLMNA